MSDQEPALWTPGEGVLHAQCKVYDVYRQPFTHPKDHRTGNFYIIRSNDWVQVLPLTQAGEIVLVRQYRFGVQELSWEVPGGVIDDGEAPIEAGLRELTEETGYQAEKAHILASCYPNPALQVNRTHFVIAEGCTLVSGQSLDANEELQVKCFSVAEFSAMARRGEVMHALAINSVFFLESYLAGKL